MVLHIKYTVDQFEAYPKAYINVVKGNGVVVIYSEYGSIRVELSGPLIKVSPTIEGFTFPAKEFKRYSGASIKIKNLLTYIK